MSRNHARLSGWRWEATRRQVFQRDNYRCRKCGRRGRLEAHHEPPLSPGVDPYNVDGVLSYCRECHVKHHKNEHMTDEQLAWQEFLTELSR